MGVDPLQEIPDPHNKIASIRSKLSRKSRVKKSFYCDHIIALRLQGNSFQKISKWLSDQGEEFYISAVTLAQTFKNVQAEYSLPYAEELAERFGGEVDFDAAHELKRIALIQRHRVDKMTRAEEENQLTGKPYYFNTRIKFEIQTLADLIKQFHGLMKNPLEAAEERSQAEALLHSVDDSDNVNAELAAFIEKSILEGTLSNDALQEFMNLL